MEEYKVIQSDSLTEIADAVRDALNVGFDGLTLNELIENLQKYQFASETIFPRQTVTFTKKSDNTYESEKLTPSAFLTPFSYYLVDIDVGVGKNFYSCFCSADTIGDSKVGFGLSDNGVYPFCIMNGYDSWPLTAWEYLECYISKNVSLTTTNDKVEVPLAIYKIVRLDSPWEV